VNRAKWAIVQYELAWCFADVNDMCNADESEVRQQAFSGKATLPDVFGNLEQARTTFLLRHKER